MTLLKNESHLLPLDKKKIKTVAVLGPDAYPAVIGGGGSCLSNPFSSGCYLEGISNYLGKEVRVAYVAENAPLEEIGTRTEGFNDPGGQRSFQGEYFNDREV